MGFGRQDFNGGRRIPPSPGGENNLSGEEVIGRDYGIPAQAAKRRQLT